MYLSRVSQQGDAGGSQLSFGLVYDSEGFVEIVGPLLDITEFEPPIYRDFVHLHYQRYSIIHCHSQWLCSTHLAKSCSKDEPSFETPSKMLPSCCCQSLVGSLEYSLRSYESPGPGSHLTEHYQ